MVAGRPFQKYGLAGREVAQANADPGEQRISFVGSQAAKQPALAEKLPGALNQTAVGFNFQLCTLPAMVLAVLARPIAKSRQNIRYFTFREARATDSTRYRQRAIRTALRCN
jgi:hypothetical protein